MPRHARRCRNVIFQIGEEFTGPKHFVEFWLDTIAGVQEKGRTVLDRLSCTKDVQDAILADPKRRAVVSVIDLKYWWYTDGRRLRPEGRADLAPYARGNSCVSGRAASLPDECASLARAVREYRTKFPDKAVTPCVVRRHERLGQMSEFQSPDGHQWRGVPTICDPFRRLNSSFWRFVIIPSSLSGGPPSVPLR